MITSIHNIPVFLIKPSDYTRQDHVDSFNEQTDLLPVPQTLLEVQNESFCYARNEIKRKWKR